MSLPSWLEPQIRGIFANGYHRRVVHPECSSDKTGAAAEACEVYRKQDGWYVHCFRCGFSQFFKDGWGSPEEVKAKLAALYKGPNKSPSAEVQLPEDFVNLKAPHAAIPMEAWEWLWKYDIGDDEVDMYNLGWSDAYKRVIIPCRTYGLLQPSNTYVHRILGWIGREVKYKSKQERQLHGGIKYLTKKHAEVKHLMFMAPSTSRRIVLMEDAISAMKVRRATGFMCIALLTTYVPKSLMMKLRTMDKVYMWLDSDMLAKSIHYVTELNRHGIRAGYINTIQDPKAYSDDSIRSQFKEE